MSNKAWVIKLGSGGRCIPFCDRHGVVGLGWREVVADVLGSASRDALLAHVTEFCPYHKTLRSRAAAAGTLFRFARECGVGDYVVYYDPPGKQVVLNRVTSDSKARDFELSDEADIWHVREVERVRAVPILDVHGDLAARIIGPRMSFWRLRPFDLVDQMAKGSAFAGPADPALERSYADLSALLMEKARALNAQDWEKLVADYFRAQGAQVDEGAVGGSRPVIDVEAYFDHGELPEELWRIQVKRLQNVVDWPMIQKDLERCGDCDEFCFVSVRGFTDEAKAKAEEEGVTLLEARHFARFLLSGKLREEVRRKLGLPAFGPA